ncbi:MAG: TetR/AcrR family transcriptional regulator [Pseudomonadota bacterium]|nr:TetR/AcrR family transcriptional regulator [Pseudomonadota bacterium]
MTVTAPARQAGVHVRRTQSERRESTQLKILEAAINILQERGFASATMQEIAREAGVTPGALQHHFGSKEALVEFIIESVFRDAGAGGLAWPDADLALDPRAAQFVDRAWKSIYGRPAYLASWQLHLGVQDTPALSRLLDTRRLRWEEIHVELFLSSFPELRAHCADPIGMATLVFSSLRGMGLLALFTGTARVINRQRAALAAVISAAGAPAKGSSTIPRSRP